MSGTDGVIGFAGLGAMGWPMAERLAAAGRRLLVLDADPARAAAFAGKTGAAVADSPGQLGAGARCVITMLPNSDVVDHVLCGEGGVLQAMAQGSTVVDMGSSVPSRTLALAEKAAALGVEIVDAPVSGGVPRAVTGELAIMAGGDAAAIDRVEPILRLMGKTVLRTGRVGTGHAMKALNNLVSAGGFLIGVEAMLIGQRFGLDPSVMVDVLNASTGMNNSTQKKFKQFVISRSFDSGFRLDLMVKDLTIALGLANEGRVPVPFASLCREMWLAAEAGGAGSDHTAVARLSERLAGFELGQPQDGNTAE